MTLGREVEGGRALALLLVDGPVSPDVVDRLLGTPNIISAKVVRI
jgi:hypothetical protein